MSKWPMVKLGDVCFKGGSNIAQKDLADNEGCYPIFGATGLIKKVDFYKQERPYIAILKDGAGVGRTMICPAKSSVIGTMQYIYPNDIVDIKFLNYALVNMKLSKYWTGAAIPHIYFKDYKEEQLPLPPLEVQKQIAAELDKIASLIEKRKSQLAKLDLLIKSKFIEMFGDPVTNPMGWEVKNLGEISRIYRGASPRPIQNYLGGDVAWIKIGDATKGDDIYISKTKDKIIEDGICKSRFVRKGSLIFANCGVSLGFARILRIDGCIHDGWLAFEGYETSLNQIFFLKSLNFSTEYFRDIAPDGTQPNLNTEIMKEHMQIVPPRPYQSEFGEFVLRIDRVKCVMKRGLEQMQIFYKERMQHYFE